MQSGSGGASLLSDSDIGSPFAFSTAVKRNSSKHSQAATASSPGGGSSFFSLDRQPNGSSHTGNISSKLAEEKNPKSLSPATTASLSLNESSLGIIDLDALQTDSSSSQLFLTSPYYIRNVHFNSGHVAANLSQPPPRNSLAGSSPLLSSGHAQTSHRLDGSTGLYAGSSVSTSVEKAPVNTSTVSRNRDSLIANSTNTSAPSSLNLVSQKPEVGRTSLQSQTATDSSEMSNTSRYSSTLDSTAGLDAKAKVLHTPPPLGMAAPTSSADSSALGSFGVSLKFKDDTPASKVTSRGSPIAPADKRNSSGSIEGSLLQSHYEGLPPELLQGMSALSGSMFSGSESEGDTILSAMASALRVCKERAPDPNILSPGSSLDGAASLSQLASPNLTGSRHGSGQGVPVESPQADSEFLSTCVHSSLHTVENFGHFPSPTDGNAAKREEKKKVSLVSKNEDLSPDYPLPKGNAVPNATSTAVKQPAHKTSSSETSSLVVDRGSGLSHQLDSPVLGGSLGSGRGGDVGRPAEALSPRHFMLAEGSQPNHLNESTESMEGLSSAYLRPQDVSYSYDPTDGTISIIGSPFHSSLPSGHAQTPAFTGSPDPSPNESKLAHGHEMPYNPFDSDNEEVVFSSQANFIKQEQGSFLEQLQKDEEQIQLFNASVSTQGGKSFDLHSSFGGAGAVAGTGAVAGAAGLVESPVSNTDPLSISSYFQRRTYALGEPFSEHRQPPENRPRFSNTLGHVIESPSRGARGTDGDISGGEGEDDLTPQCKSTLSLDRTLVDEGSDPVTAGDHTPSGDLDIDQHLSLLDNKTEHARSGPFEHTVTPVQTKLGVPKFSLGSTLSPGMENPSPDISETPLKLHSGPVQVISSAANHVSMLTNQPLAVTTPISMTPLMSSTKRSLEVTSSSPLPATTLAGEVTPRNSPIKSTLDDNNKTYQIPPRDSSDFKTATNSSQVTQTLVSSSDTTSYTDAVTMLSSARSKFTDTASLSMPSQMPVANPGPNTVGVPVVDAHPLLNANFDAQMKEKVSTATTGTGKVDPASRNGQEQLKDVSSDPLPVVSMEEMKRKLLRLQQDLLEAKASANQLVASRESSRKPIITKIELVHESSKSKVQLQSQLETTQKSLGESSGLTTSGAPTASSSEPVVSAVTDSGNSLLSVDLPPAGASPSLLDHKMSSALPSNRQFVLTSSAGQSSDMNSSTDTFSSVPNSLIIEQSTIAAPGQLFSSNGVSVSSKYRNALPVSIAPLVTSAATSTSPSAAAVESPSPDPSKKRSVEMQHSADATSLDDLRLVATAPLVSTTATDLPSPSTKAGLLTSSGPSITFSAKVTYPTLPLAMGTNTSPPRLPVTTLPRQSPPTPPAGSSSRPLPSHQQRPPMLPVLPSTNNNSKPAALSPLARRVVFSPPKLHRDVAIQSILSPRDLKPIATVSSTHVTHMSTQTATPISKPDVSSMDQSTSYMAYLNSKQDSGLVSTGQQSGSHIYSSASADVDSLVMNRLAHLVTSKQGPSFVDESSATPTKLERSLVAGVVYGLNHNNDEEDAGAGLEGSMEVMVPSSSADSLDKMKTFSVARETSASSVTTVRSVSSESSSVLPPYVVDHTHLSSYVSLPSSVKVGSLPVSMTTLNSDMTSSVEAQPSLPAPTQKVVVNSNKADYVRTSSETKSTTPRHTPLAPPPTHFLQVPSEHQFSEVCCAGIPSTDYVQLKNCGERWLQVSVSVRSARLDGQPFTNPGSIFKFPQTMYVEHDETRLLKVTFCPILCGKYEADVEVFASYMIGADHSQSGPPAATFVLQAEVEQPQLELRSRHLRSNGSDRVLDYGLMVGGSTVKCPLELINRGRVELPLEMTIVSDSLQVLECFNFRSLPDSLDISADSSTPDSARPLDHAHYLNPIKLTLPGCNSASNSPRPHTLEVSFTPPLHYSLAAMKSSTNEPVEVRGQLEFHLKGRDSRAGPLQTVALKATVGEAKLFIPKALEAVTLSCTVGQAVTRVVPICNSGNVPVTARLSVEGKDPAHFSLGTNSIILEPNEESQVKVTFDPPTAPLIAEALIQVHIEPGGPSFNVKLRGTAVTQPPPSDGILSCNKRYLYWGGVALGGSKYLELQLHNSFSVPIPLKLSVRHPHTPFQVDQDEVILMPKDEVLVKVNFFPFSTSVFVTALDIVDKYHSKKFRVPLCGYGGVSKIEVGGIKYSPKDGHQLDIGNIRNSINKKVKVLMYNSGSRASVVHVSCRELDSHTPIPETRVRISPSAVVIPAHSTGEVHLYYRPTKEEEEKCVGAAVPVAQLVVHSGDECVRQKMVHSMREERPGKERGGSGKPSPFITRYFTDLPSQDEVEKALIDFQLDDIESVFTSHLVLTSIILVCSSKVGGATTKSKPLSSQNPSTPKPLPRHPLSLSLTPVESVIGSSQVVPPPNLFTIQEEGAGSKPQSSIDVLKSRQGRPNATDKRRHVAKWVSQTKHLLPESSDQREQENERFSADKKMVYLSKSFILFPDTPVGSQAMVKVPVNNRDSLGHSLEVIKPSPPFSVSHRSFNLGSRMSARLPVYFMPTYSGVFEGILAVCSKSGHQAFAQLRGKAVP